MESVASEIQPQPEARAAAGDQLNRALDALKGAQKTQKSAQLFKALELVHRQVEMTASLVKIKLDAREPVYEENKWLEKLRNDFEAHLNKLTDAICAD